MTKHRRVQEETKFWHADDIGDVELLKATYVTHTFSRHTHEGYVIGVIERGVEAFTYRGEHHRAPAGSIVIINPDEVHTGHAINDQGWTYRTMYPETSLLQQVSTEIAGKSQHAPPYFPKAVVHDRYLVSLFRNLHATLETSSCALERESVFNAVMAQLILRHADDRPIMHRIGKENHAVQQVKEFLQANYAQNISLKELAGEINFSPFYLTRVFSKTMGLPPHVYLTQIRILQAKKLLSANYPISVVADKTGFTDQSHLTRHFKRIVGVPPGQYTR